MSERQKNRDRKREGTERMRLERKEERERYFISLAGPLGRKGPVTH